MKITRRNPETFKEKWQINFFVVAVSLGAPPGAIKPA
jgi:hypothetical protein